MNIVIVDDDYASALLSKTAILHHDSTCVVTILPDGEQLINYFAEATTTLSLPDLILLDLNLPKLPGKDIIKAIKTNDAYKRIPIVVLSASQNSQDIIDCLYLHANCFVKKDLDYDIFSEKMKALLHFWQEIAAFPQTNSFAVAPIVKEREQTDGIDQDS